MKIRNLVSKKPFVLAILSIIAFFTYFSSINSSFQLDDTQNISENSDIMIEELSFSSLKRASMTQVSGLRPVSYLSFALNYYFSGSDTTPYHTVNLIIHIINAFLIYMIILTLFDYDTLEIKEKDKLLVSAALTALIWLVTPLNSHAVISIVQRMALLMTMFFLISFLMYLYGRKKRNAIYFVFCGISFFLSLMSKQNAIILPLVIIAYEFVFIKKGELKSITKMEALFFAILFLSSLFILYTYRGRIGQSFVRGYSLRDFTMYERVLTQSRVLIFYLSLLFLPLPDRLCVTHDILKSTSIFSPISTLLSIIFILSLILFSIVRIRKSPYLSFALLWFFTTISVESTILPLEMIFEHRMYLPGIFLFAAFVDFVVKKFYDKRKALILAVFASIIVIFSTLTGVRGKVWENPSTLWSDVLKKYPNDARAMHNIGFIYYKKGDFANAIDWYNKALQADPENINALFGLGDIYQRKYFNDVAEEYYKKALSHSKPDYVIHKMALINLGALYFDTKKYDKAVNTYNELIRHYPKDGELHHNLGIVYKNQNDIKAAAEEFKLAIHYGYTIPRAFENALESMIKINEINEAIDLYRRYKEIVDKLCVNYLVKAEIARTDNDHTGAERFNSTYLKCLNAKRRIK